MVWSSTQTHPPFCVMGTGRGDRRACTDARTHLHAGPERRGGARELEARGGRKGGEEGEGHAEGQEEARLLVRGEGEEAQAGKRDGQVRLPGGVEGGGGRGRGEDEVPVLWVWV